MKSRNSGTSIQYCRLTRMSYRLGNSFQMSPESMRSPSMQSRPSQPLLDEEAKPRATVERLAPSQHCKPCRRRANCNTESALPDGQYPTINAKTEPRKRDAQNVLGARVLQKTEEQSICVLLVRSQLESQQLSNSTALFDSSKPRFTKHTVSM